MIRVCFIVNKNNFYHATFFKPLFVSLWKTAFFREKMKSDTVIGGVSDRHNPLLNLDIIINRNENEYLLGFVLGRRGCDLYGWISSTVSHMIAGGMAGDHITRGGFHTFSSCAWERDIRCYLFKFIRTLLMYWTMRKYFFVWLESKYDFLYFYFGGFLLVLSSSFFCCSSHFNLKLSLLS